MHRSWISAWRVELNSGLQTMVTHDFLTFEQLNIGDRWKSDDRNIHASDINCFADLTGDRDRLHTDPEFAADGPFGKPVAHGLLGLSILAGLSSNAPAVRTAALVDIRGWKFERPIFVGDSIHAVTEVIDLKPHGRRHGEVHWYRQLINQKGEKVQEGILVTLVARSIPLPNKRGERPGSTTPEAAITTTVEAPIGV